MNTQVSIATKPLVYSAFRYINNKVYNALAEYVDNSIASFLHHKDLLTKLNPKGKLSVYITIDVDNDTIIIEDNAFGIEAKDYDRAFELANIPLDSSGLNEFGMGMKVSSIWLSNLWSVETSAYGESVKKTLVFDLNEVVKDERLSLDVQLEPLASDEHYTRVTLKSLSQNKPSSRQLQYIKSHLTSIYTKFIRDGILDLYINDVLQELEDLKILNAPYYKTPDEKPIKWCHEVNYDFPKFNGEPNEMYRVHGFIGILETMSTSTNNGFLLFRRGRVIGSSYDNRYRPKVLCGDEGSPRYKRIFGELEIEGFNVSFTKNSFAEDDEFELFIKLLKEKIENDASFDIFGQAQNYTKPKAPVSKKDADALNNTLAKAFAKTIVTSKPAQTSAPAKQAPQPVKVEVKSDAISDTIPVKIDIDGVSFDLDVKHLADSTSDNLYRLSKVGENKYQAVMNLRNPFFNQYRDILNGKDGYLPVASFIKTMVTTELILRDEGASEDASRFRMKFNELFGKI